MQAISLNLNFSGVVLPVVDCEDGFQRVPLKPIADVIGVDWENQRKKVQVGYLTRRLGIRTDDFLWAGQEREMVAIRVDRVAAFLLSINPDSVRGAGNTDAADWLEAKHREWDDLIHAYEQQRGQLFGGSFRKAMALTKIDKMRDLALKKLALAELGITLPETKEPPKSGDLFAA